jgi:hypothetical protein
MQRRCHAEQAVSQVTHNELMKETITTTSAVTDELNKHPKAQHCTKRPLDLKSMRLKQFYIPLFRPDVGGSGFL